jgi:hypothetical protein
MRLSVLRCVGGGFTTNATENKDASGAELAEEGGNEWLMMS